VLALNPDALAIADRLDAERKSRGPRGPLHGIPILLKDNIATADRMMTTAGSLALAGATPPKDAFLDERLERPRRPDEESACARSQSVRLELWLWRGRRGELERGGDWNGDRRVDRVAVEHERPDHRPRRHPLKRRVRDRLRRSLQPWSASKDRNHPAKRLILRRPRMSVIDKR
jgi:hypothetical protein